VIRCNRDGLFRIKYPAEVVQLLGEPEEAVAKTMDEAEKEFGQRLWEYEQAGTSTRKVIIYRVEMKAAILHPDDDRPSLKRNDISFGRGLGVTVWADVFEETCVKLAGDKARYSYDRVESELPISIRHSGNFRLGMGAGAKQDECMEWTPEREAFFCRVAEAMESLCLKLDEMTNAGADTLAQIADTWSGSLLPGPDQEA